MNAKIIQVSLTATCFSCFIWLLLINSGWSKYFLHDVGFTISNLNGFVFGCFTYFCNVKTWILPYTGMRIFSSSIMTLDILINVKIVLSIFLVLFCSVIEHRCKSIGQPESDGQSIDLMRILDHLFHIKHTILFVVMIYVYLYNVDSFMCESNDKIKSSHPEIVACLGLQNSLSRLLFISCQTHCNTRLNP